MPDESIHITPRTQEQKDVAIAIKIVELQARVHNLEDTLRCIAASAEPARFYNDRDSVNIELRAIVDLCREALQVEP